MIYTMFFMSNLLINLSLDTMVKYKAEHMEKNLIMIVATAGNDLTQQYNSAQHTTMTSVKSDIKINEA